MDGGYAPRLGFDCPLRTAADVERLLGCPHAAPTDLVGCEFTGAVRDADEAETGRVVLSVDSREPLTAGPHAVVDLRLVLGLAIWHHGFLFPPCTHQVLSDTRVPPRVWVRVRTWVYRTLGDLICIRDFGDACERSRPPGTLVIGPADLYPEYDRYHDRYCTAHTHMMCGCAVAVKSRARRAVREEFMNNCASA